MKIPREYVIDIAMIVTTMLTSAVYALVVVFLMDRSYYFAMGFSLGYATGVIPLVIYRFIKMHDDGDSFKSPRGLANP